MNIMKNRHTIFSTSGVSAAIALCSLSLAPAIEPPADESKPPAALLGNTTETQLADAPPIVRNSVAFLGVATAEVPPMLAEHLGLDSGTGVIIQTVSPESPAEKAGLSVNDIITAVDNETITSPDHFSNIIGGSEIGDSIALDLVHKGDSLKMEISLIERPAGLQSGIEQEPLFDGLPNDHTNRLRGLLEQSLRSFGAEDFGDIAEPLFDNNLRKMNEQLRRNMENGNGSISGVTQNSTIRLMDQEGSVEIKTADGSTQVTVRDTSNNTVWQGPWDTEEDKAAAPEDIRHRVERIDAGQGLNFRFGIFGD